ncbi:MAG: type II CAAX endopeptidase family protein [Cyanobacteria bacterium P01_A01_bin.114]
MTIKRAVLWVITLLVITVMGASLVNSWNEPQVTGQLQLYQSNLMLEATEWSGEGFSKTEVSQIRTALLGKAPLETVISEYQDLQEQAKLSLERSQAQLNALDSSAVAPESPQYRKLANAIGQQQILIDRLSVRLGLLRAQQGETEAAVAVWQPLTADANSPYSTTAQVLIELWGAAPVVASEAETILTTHLDGWFGNRALEQFYTVQDSPQALAQLAAQEQAVAQTTFLKLITIGALPTLGSIVGAVLLVVLAIQWGVKGKAAVLAHNQGKAWQVPWDAEIIWQVLVVGFFFLGQILLPYALSMLGLSFATTSSRMRAVYSMVYYLMMASGGIAVLIGSIKPHFPLPEGWFRFRPLDKWPLWGWGGYFCVLPLMIGVSLLNQKLWQGQGGSNPLLQTVLEETDTVALVLFFLTASVAAPLFEEVLFRGFLLPSLTRYMPVGGAIALSSFIFAAAHLSLSEVLPLTVLGAALGFVYTRSRNLLAPILLHSTWNSVTMLGLFLLSP